MLDSPKITPFFEETARTTLLKISCALNEVYQERPLVLLTYSGPYSLSHPTKRGSEVLPPI